ncbi:hypothetical protein ABZX72_29545 [Streptomyces cyaneofuscatus]|uniref:hypothetical protein n=1 Tax=Streptomyces cyaneofuscatus TaxID=66883 RepID=UPI0033BEFD13
MTRLQILELPMGADDERPPFVLVVDQYTAQRVVTGARQTAASFVDPMERAAGEIGARGTLVFAETVEIPANDVSAEFREGLQEDLGKMYETARRSLSESETLGHTLLQRAENAEGRSHAMEVQRNRAARHAEQAEAGRLAADKMLRAVCEVFGGPHQDPVVKARETLARAKAAEAKLQTFVKEQQRAAAEGGHVFGEPGYQDPSRCARCGIDQLAWFWRRDSRTCSAVIEQRAEGTQTDRRPAADVRLMNSITDAAGFDRMNDWGEVLAALRESRGASDEGHPELSDEDGGR